MKSFKEYINESDDGTKAHDLAKEHNIKINYKDKYVKGYKAKGPRNYKKANLESINIAIKNGWDEVTFWRG